MKRFCIGRIQSELQAVVLAIIVLVALSCVSAKADVLVSYQMATNNFTPAPANGGAASGATAPYSSIVDNSLLSSASTITIGPGDNFGGSTLTNIALTYRSGGAFIDGSGGSGLAPVFPTLNAQLPNSTVAFLNPNPNIYFQFSFTASSAFNLTTLAYDMSMGSTSASTRGAEVLYSLDNFTTSTDLGGNAIAGGTADDYFYYSFNLGNALVNAGQTVTVRFEPTTTSGGGIRFDNIEVDGTPVVVPEPATMALLEIGGLGVLLLKRRRA